MLGFSDRGVVNWSSISLASSSGGSSARVYGYKVNEVVSMLAHIRNDFCADFEVLASVAMDLVRESVKETIACRNTLA